MKTLRLLLFLLFCVGLNATTLTEYYVQTTGDNLNAGSDANDAPKYTLGGTFVRATGVFTPTNFVPSGGSIVIGTDCASLYDGAAAVSELVGRVSATNDTTITIDITGIAGATANIDEGSEAAFMRIGGAWKGPNAAVGFPFNFATATLTNGAGNVPRINFKNDDTYDVTAVVTHTLAGPIRFQGYTSAPGDLGKFTIDSGTAAISVLTITGANIDLVDCIAVNNASSGGGEGITIATGGECLMLRVVVSGARGRGFYATTQCTYIECEAYNNNRGNYAAYAGFTVSSGSILVRCISHDNAGSNAHGYSAAASILVNCIADSNGASGFLSASISTMHLFGCDAFGNGGSGLDLTGASALSVVIDGCNFVDNTAYGINSSGSSIRSGLIRNCGFGSGTRANDSGNFGPNITGSQNGIDIVGSFSYADDALPWSGAATGDFRIDLATAKGMTNTFTQTQGSYTGTVAYPDRGAAQHKETSAGGATSHTWAQ